MPQHGSDMPRKPYSDYGNALDIDTANFLSYEDLCERARKGAFLEILMSFLRVAFEG